MVQPPLDQSAIRLLQVNNLSFFFLLPIQFLLNFLILLHVLLQTVTLYVFAIQHDHLLETWNISSTNGVENLIVLQLNLRFDLWQVLVRDKLTVRFENGVENHLNYWHTAAKGLERELWPDFHNRVFQLDLPEYFILIHGSNLMLFALSHDFSSGLIQVFSNGLLI